MAQEHSKACCTVPAAKAGPYTGHGRWSEVDGLKTYETGQSDATKGILFMYDIFAYTPQTLQGADILGGEYFVVVPDWFEGNAASVSWFPTDTDEKKAKLNGLLQNEASPAKVVPQIYQKMDALKAKYPNIKSWSSIGYCIGGKFVALTAGEGTPFKSALQTSPAMIDPTDAEKVTIPMAVLASKDEDEEKVKAFGEALNVPRHIETFKGQIHGFMSARANLEDSAAKSAYEDGYRAAVDFFKQHA